MLMNQCDSSDSAAEFDDAIFEQFLMRDAKWCCELNFKALLFSAMEYILNGVRDSLHSVLLHSVATSGNSYYGKTPPNGEIYLPIYLGCYVLSNFWTFY